eukprot:233313_1
MSLFLLFNLLSVCTFGVVTYNTLPSTLRVDNNDVMVGVRQNAYGKTRIYLVTPSDAWHKTLQISSSSGFYQVDCGDNWGTAVPSTSVNGYITDTSFKVNADYKFAGADLGYGTQGVSIQFIKAKTFGIATHFVTLTLSSTVTLGGYDIMFFWPNDNNVWGNFLNILDQTKKVTYTINGIATDVLSIGEENRKDLIEGIKAIGEIMPGIKAAKTNDERYDYGPSRPTVQYEVDAAAYFISAGYEKGIDGKVKIDENGNVFIDLDLTNLDLSACDFSNDEEISLKYRIHDKWEYGEDESEAKYSPDECSADMTGYNFDPFTAGLCDDIKTEDIGYYNCAIGDLSGRFGVAKPDEDNKIFIENNVSQIMSANGFCGARLSPEDLSKKSIVFSCNDDKSTNLFCAPFVITVRTIIIAKD